MSKQAVSSRDVPHVSLVSTLSVAKLVKTYPPRPLVCV